MTDLTKQNNTEGEIAVMAQQVPLGRIAEPNEIASTVLFLASTSNTYITGQNLLIDGGFTHA